ncbi:MAG: SpoIIE family protein phosphatase, partial [Flavobacteriales bacterium]
VNFVRGKDTVLFLADFNGLVKYKGNDRYERVFSCAPWDVCQAKKLKDVLLIPDAVNGLNVLFFKGDSFESYTIPGLENKSCRQIYEDIEGNFWLSDETNGIYRIQIQINPGRKPDFSMKRFDERDGLPEGYSFAFDFNNRLYFGTEGGFYEFLNETFSKSKFLHLTFAKHYTIHRANTDPQGNLWVSAYDVDNIKKYFFGYAQSRNGKLIWTHQPFLKVSEEKIDCIFHENENITWLGGPEGLFRFNKERSGNFKRNYRVLLRKLRIGDDSLVYAGSGKYEEDQFVFPFSSQHYFFDFSATYYRTLNGVKYSFYLEGFDKTWSKYASNHYVEFSNLYEGDYTLHVKALDDYGNQSKYFTVAFTVRAPWYRTTWAYIGYGVIFILIIVGAVRISSKGLKNIIKQRTREIEEQKHLVEEKNKEIIDSISYAERLQQAILPNIKVIHDVMPDSFVMYKPKDIIAGDFYWMEIINGQILFAVCDCTGHGVPGAMVSVVGANSLNRCVKEFQLTQPAKILDQLTFLVEETFSKSDSEVKDGMDVALVSLSVHTESGVWSAEYSGANNPLWIIRNGVLTEIKADKQPIGKFDKRKPFTNHTIEIKKGDAIYLCSDGFADQFGGESGKKFKYGKLKELIVENWTLPMDQQHRIYNRIFENWRGEQEQTDDVCLWGVKF